MPLLAPSHSAPATPTTNHVSTKSSSTKTPTATTSNTVMITAPPTRHRKFPIVTLQTPTISDLVASKLASSFLGHILFLKSQIPLPVAQLSRITGTKSTLKATKHRTELLSSYDILSSHLDSTFTSLSTAIARSSAFTCSNASSSSTSQRHSNRAKSNSARAYIAFVIGSSITAPRARVFFAVDGMEVKVWGQREDVAANGDNGEEVNDRVNGEEEESEEGDEDDADLLEDSDSGDRLSASEATESEAHWSTAEAYGSTTSNSCSDVDEGSGDETEGESVYSDCEQVDLPDSLSEDESDYEEIPSSPPPPSLPTPSELQAADRLLSRTLASFASNEEESDEDPQDFAAELAPTQIHILIRAPRRFSHPAWLPKQNVTVGMENALGEFLSSSFTSSSPAEKDLKKKGKGVKNEGVWVVPSSGLNPETETEEKGNIPEKDNEDDDMIWWAWEGKIVGFSDW